MAAKLVRRARFNPGKVLTPRFRLRFNIGVVNGTLIRRQVFYLAAGVHCGREMMDSALKSDSRVVVRLALTSVYPVFVHRCHAESTDALYNVPTEAFIARNVPR